MIYFERFFLRKDATLQEVLDWAIENKLNLAEVKYNYSSVFEGEKEITEEEYLAIINYRPPNTIYMDGPEFLNSLEELETLRKNDYK
jgi:hypothetical protein